MLDTLLSGNASIIDILISILSALAVVFLTLPIHEFAHAFVADKLGDPTPRYQRRLTINPFAHIDYVGALCIILFGFGWAKPVQVNSYNFKSPKKDMALVAFAGPLSNLIVAFLSLACCKVVTLFSPLVYIDSFAYYIFLFFMGVATINIYLAVFNLIPVPPLDGSRILSIILPDKYYYRLMQYERYIYFILLALLFTNILDAPIRNAASWIFDLFVRILNF